MKAKIQKGNNREFVVETPTSVATVKGTVFWLVASLTGDKVFGLEGIIELQNTISGDIVMVGINETGTSLINGDVNVAQTDPADVPTLKEDQEINEIELEYEDPNGNQKTMKIRYH